MQDNNEKNYQELTFIAVLLTATDLFGSNFPFMTRIANLNEDERRVFVEAADFVLQGLEKGRTNYGPLRLHQDKRDLEQEAREELRDGLVYMAAAKLKKQINNL